ncbi:bifunctional diguanylate cyclase/phosphodiesterase [Croceibacterium ferulae]|uniref:bifunctional diguanylate cyclase/phosphodiesterase n=1 Tax=Croceibacterium ferulae TaxID=1854641 RepID=UPI000EADF3C1|nr:bifunctional diguanylate cyclase/phosphodiesterase [Croceibacterium ferulae]
MTTRTDRDRLTGLIGPDAARRRLAEWQQAATGLSERGVCVHAMLLRFRSLPSVNLAYGVAAGDRTLAQVAARLTEFADRHCPADHLLARIGGGNFLLAVHAAMGREQWQGLAEQIALIMAEPIADAGGGTVRLWPRIALLRSPADVAPDLILGRLANTLDRASEQPARRLLWADGVMALAEPLARQLEADLLPALDRNEIEVLFQPQYSSADRRLVGAEALARWRHPELGRLGAIDLFAIAERADHVAPLSRHLARMALATAARWPDHLRLSLNVTADELAASDFTQRLQLALAEGGFPPARLTLEITEQSLVSDLEASATQLRELARSGVRIALDDFGAGFCNFLYLKLLPIHYLKLDRSMVEGIVDDARDLAVLRGIVAMARALDLVVVAEGIETEAQRAAVAAEGCAIWQGFLGAPPLTGADLAALALR